MYDHLSDDDAERLLSGPADGDPLAAKLESLRSHYASMPAPAPSEALSEFVSADLMAESTHSADEVIYLTSPRSKERKMSISTFVGTAAGKFILGASVAAASVGGAHVTGVVDVPILPEVESEEIAEAEVDDDGTATFDASGDSGSDDDSASDDFDDSEDFSDSDDSDDSDDSTKTTAPGSAMLTVGPTTFVVLNIGTVEIEGNSTDGLVVSDTSVTEASDVAGWTAEIDNHSDEPGEAGVNFRNGEDRVDFRAQIEDGRLRVRVRDRRTDTIEEIWYDENGDVTSKPSHDGSDDDSSDDDSTDDSSDDDSTDDSSDDDSTDDSSDDDSTDDSSDDDSTDDDSTDDNSGSSDSNDDDEDDSDSGSDT